MKKRKGPPQSETTRRPAPGKASGFFPVNIYETRGDQRLREDLLEMWKDMAMSGVPLDPFRMNLLKTNGYITEENGEVTVPVKQYPTLVRAENELVAKEKTSPEAGTGYRLNVERINKSQWLPHSGNPLEPNEDFVALIDSIIRGFSHRIYNTQLDVYQQQAERWINMNFQITNCKTRTERRVFLRRERDRCKINSLYALNRHLWLKEGESNSGRVKYTAWPPQAFVLWLIDSGFSMLLGKMRQIGISSTIGGATAKDVIMTRSFFCKFITESGTKGEEIFDDKIKYAVSNWTSYMLPTISNNRDRLLKCSYSPEKGIVEGVESKLMVEPPYRTAINGGSPNRTLIDEVGNIKILGAMMMEGRPAMFFVNEQTGKMQMRRQMLGWGTGGEMKGDGAAFEIEFKAAIEAWQRRDFAYGIVPVFLDCFSKPGFTQELYDQEQRVYLARGRNAEEQELYSVMFHQHYPVTLDDMFLQSSKTIIPIKECNDRIRYIHDMDPLNDKPVWGKMEPIYDELQPSPEHSYVPFKIIGARFMPMADHDPAATICMFRKPQLNWRNRYFQGTDPIYTETGRSLMASSIWDNHHNLPCALMNFRTTDYRYCYLQSMLLGIYYNKDIDHLIESNVGSGLYDFIDGCGYGHTIIPNAALPAYLQSPTGQGWGINNKAGTAKDIIHNTLEVIKTHGHKIFFEDFWVQLKTFVEKTTVSGKYKWEADNKTRDRDDSIYGITFSYICAKACGLYPPQNLDKVVEKAKNKARMVYDRRTGQTVLKRIVPKRVHSEEN